MQMLKVWLKKIKRIPIHFLIKNLVHWEQQSASLPGYTIIIGCMHKLPELAVANIKLLVKTEQTSRNAIYLVFDCSEEELDDSVTNLVSEFADSHSIKLIFYTPKQIAVARKIDWGWVYAWLSWVIGISKARTKHVILHDLDALPIDDGIFETCYQNTLESGAQFQGIQTYKGNGVSEGMGLATTFQLVIDAEYVRANFRPYDAFNHVEYVNGAYVDFDTFLYIQFNSTKISVSPIDETQMFHPTQMICQFTDFMAGRDSLANSQHNLLALIYLQYLGGNRRILSEVTSELSAGGETSITFNSLELRVDQLTQEQWAWLEKQIRRLEQALFENTRTEVSEFLGQLAHRAGNKRTVGSEYVIDGGVTDN